MLESYERIYINNITKNNRKFYLEFLISYGFETYKFYKHAIKYSKKMLVYKENDIIKGIIGFSHNISLEMSKLMPSYCILNIRLIYCNEKQLFEQLLTDITRYAIENRLPCIYINHMKLYDNVIIESEYNKCSCNYICLSSGICIKCYENDIFSNSYYKDINDCNINRYIFHK